AASKRAFTILVTDCRVDYRGRSSSKMNWGERVVMLKPDGSVLIHRKTGYDAVNWQPPGCYITLSRQDGELSIRADRRNPRETLTITCREVLFVSALSLTDEATFDMLLAEQDLYRVLLNNPDMIERGFRISSQQKGLGRGKADITGYDKEGRYTVVEVKRVPADVEAVKQLYKYISEMRETSPDVRGILAAPGMRPAAKKLSRSLSIEYRQIDLKRCAEMLSKERSVGMERLDRHLV
ncbi:MAG: endonuclease NucS, partial [Nitrososphaerales archaeon]